MKLLLKYLMMLTKSTNFIAKTKLILGHCKMKEMKKEKKERIRREVYNASLVIPAIH